MIKNNFLINDNKCNICLKDNYICGHEIYHILRNLNYVGNNNLYIKNKISHYFLSNINNYVFNNIIKIIELKSILFNNIDFNLCNKIYNPNKYLISLRMSFQNHFINLNKYFYSLIESININQMIDQINKNYHNYNVKNNYIGKKNLINKPYCLFNKRIISKHKSISISNNKHIDYFNENKFTYFILKETYIFNNIRNNLFKNIKIFYEDQIRILLLIKKLTSYHHLFNKYIIRNISSYLINLNIQHFVSLKYD